MDYNAEIKMLTIFQAVLNNDFQTINTNYNELSNHFDSLKILINTYWKERRKSDSNILTYDDLIYLIYVLEALPYIDRPLNNDDIDTIKLLLNLSYLKVNINASFRNFKRLLILIYYNKPGNDIDLIRSMNDAVQCFLNNYQNNSLEGLKLPKKIYELYDISALAANKLNDYHYFERSIILLLIIYGSFNNNFEYFYNYMNNQIFFEEHLSHNGFINYDMRHDYKNLFTIYNNIDIIFTKPKYIIK
ncbi:MAG: hypothetical protein J6X02_01935 [Bacilli bacterium]|nr:hypothetical protein [Bacilli bacterium]